APPARRRSVESFAYVSSPAGGVGRTCAHTGEEHLAGVGPAGHDGVIAQHLGVAERGALLAFAFDLADRRVDINHQTLGAGPGAQGPRPAENLADHGFELAHMTERE